MAGRDFCFQVRQFLERHLPLLAKALRAALCCVLLRLAKAEEDEGRDHACQRHREEQVCQEKSGGETVQS